MGRTYKYIPVSDEQTDQPKKPKPIKPKGRKKRTINDEIQEALSDDSD